MKNIYTMTVLLIFMNIKLFCQSKNYDINILIDKEVVGSMISNDSLIYQTFLLKDMNYTTKKKISYDKNGKLITSLSVSGATNKDDRLVLFYKDVNGNNPPTLLKKEKVKNLLVYPRDFKGLEISNVRDLLKNSKNIFVIESDSVYGFYVLKKVSLMKK